MKVLQSSLFRAFCSIAIGALLIKYRGATVTWITIAIGILFLVSGVISCVTYFMATRHADNYKNKITDVEGNVINNYKPVFPIVGLGSIILGLLLAITPTIFVTTLMYILGAVLILGAINQYMNLANARKIGKIPFVFWICPTVILLTGLFVVVKPMETAELPLLIIGWCSLLYGITEIINAMKVNSQHRNYKKMMQQMEQESPTAQIGQSDTGQSDASDNTL